MKITHICLTGPFSEGWSYQENLITKYHKKLGHDVTIIASEFAWNKEGKIIRDSNTDYINGDGVRIIRIASKYGTTITSKIKLYHSLYKTIADTVPDILFVHGVQFPGIMVVRKYVNKHPEMKLYIDNHADFSNSASNWLSRLILHRMIWRWFAKRISPMVNKFYGVMPARVDFLVSEYHLPKEKIELLVMGADDEKVQHALLPSVRNELRDKYNIRETDFLIVTGGKIDKAKMQTITLMEAVQKLQNKDVKLIVFGSVAEELKGKMDVLSDGEKIQYIGWIEPDESYEYFAMSDLVVFPGRHSVFWEQVAGIGVPMICKKWSGTTHVDCGGNVYFLEKDNFEDIIEGITAVMRDYDKYKQAAQNAKKNFAYSVIAQKSIEE